MTIINPDDAALSLFPDAVDFQTRLMEKMRATIEDRLAGYVAWIALQDPFSPWLSGGMMAAVLGPWVNDPWVWRDHDVHLRIVHVAGL